LAKISEKRAKANCFFRLSNLLEAVIGILALPF